MLIVTTSAALLIGFLGGLLTFRRASHWCRVCGRTLGCRAGHDATAPVRS